MSDIVIKTRVSLDFLGEDYKDGFIVLKSIPTKELDAIQDKAATIEEEDVKANGEFIKNEVKSRLIDGSIPQDGKSVSITEDNIEDLPPVVFSRCFERLMGKVSPN